MNILNFEKLIFLNYINIISNKNIFKNDLSINIFNILNQDILNYFISCNLMEFNFKNNIITNSSYYYKKNKGIINDLFFLKYNYITHNLLKNTNFFINYEPIDRKEILSFFVLMILEIFNFDQKNIYFSHILINKEKNEERYSIFLEDFNTIYNNLYEEITKNNEIKEQGYELFNHIIKLYFNHLGFGFNVIHNSLKEKTINFLKFIKISYTSYDLEEINLFIEDKENNNSNYNYLSYGCILNPNFIIYLLDNQEMPIEVLYYLKKTFSNIFTNKDILEKVNFKIKTIKEKELILNNIIKNKNFNNSVNLSKNISKI